MNTEQTNRLAQILAWCEKFLANVATKRTPGEWTAERDEVKLLNPTPFLAYKSVAGGRGNSLAEAMANAAFIAAASKAFEAAVRDTVGRIRGHLAILEARGNVTYMSFSERELTTILDIWQDVNL